ncbi:protein of unknown function (DUF4331) [Abditibacterium utsteinense]|uniref:DUF4331 domain-containing protein n=1 Tax=Abditibacterium utsteinense TaxID=1960156 RepID=A0A2S8SRD1_9BACT|nr:DUF4331 family protein [Abditibacterium utsteinense]PQV63336.1 protein of unknown function (DUF4331) [Abditibacterium utsteinense]
MLFSSKRSKKLLALSAVAATALTVGAERYAIGSDHAGTTISVTKPGIDLSDLHIFPGSNADNVVLAMSVHPLIPAGQATADKFSFDTDVLYQFKIDTNDDKVEDLVIQAKFEGTGANQRVLITGPVKPSRVGTTTVFERPFSTTGTFNQAFSPTPGMQVFAGFRGDPFFIDLDQLFNIFPDRATPPKLRPAPAKGQENTPMATSFRPAGQAKDFLANFNVLALVVEVPRAKLGGGKIGVWETTSVAK